MSLAELIEPCEFIIRRHFQIRFNLTPAETRLAYQLLSGRSLKECARDLCVSYETARGTLKTVFRKTGVRRQTELILLITLPPN
jgi:DNA-binding CsgD family transcriptional regulator